MTAHLSYDENMLISIVIPVYNVEKYLKTCIESVLDQTYRDIEIILVDDGSTDSSGSICDEYAKKDSRITVIHKKNQGLGLARNSGMELVKGSFVTFLVQMITSAAPIFRSLPKSWKRKVRIRFSAGSQELMLTEMFSPRRHTTLKSTLTKRFKAAFSRDLWEVHPRIKILSAPLYGTRCTAWT